MKRLLKSLLLIIIVLSFGIVLVSCSSENNGGNNDKTEEEKTTKDSGVSLVDNNVVLQLASNSSTVTSTEEAVQKVYDSVVCVYVMSNDTAVSAGSGVIIGQDEEGYYVITCQHVVDGYDDYIVTLSDGSYIEAENVGEDAVTDLAVLKIKGENLTVATIIQDSTTIAIGSEAIAIGNPLGTLANSVTKGIVSAVNRDIKMSDGTVQNLIQTDAAINGGNSGGGLFNNQGQLIGVVSAKYSATGVEGLGFAIPANTVVSIATELIENGYVSGRTSLGLKFGDGYIRMDFFRATQVVYVTYVDPNGSAYGLIKTNYIITGVKVDFADNTKASQSLTTISDSETLTNFLTSLNLEIGDIVTFTVKTSSNSAEKEIAVTLKQYK